MGIETTRIFSKILWGRIFHFGKMLRLHLSMGLVSVDGPGSPVGPAQAAQLHPGATHVVSP